MKNRNLIRYIPSYPKGCSLELLAVKASYVSKPYTDGNMRKGIKRLCKDLAWLTLKEDSLVERRLPTQVSSKKALQKLGVPDQMKDMTIYISRKA